jgi:excisionase family DNA binding protein
MEPYDLEGRLFITVDELAEIMHLDPRMVRRGIQEGEIPAVRVGRSTRIPVPKVRALAGLPGPAPANSEAAPASATIATTGPMQEAHGHGATHPLRSA